MYILQMHNLNAKVLGVLGYKKLDKIWQIL
jgi:hypothetical protein